MILTINTTPTSVSNNQTVNITVTATDTAVTVEDASVNVTIKKSTTKLASLNGTANTVALYHSPIVLRPEQLVLEP